MGQTKQKLKNGQPVYGGWMMIGHPTVAELMTGEGFDWICVDMEHTSTDLNAFHQIALAVKGTNVDLLVRLGSTDADLAKRVLDAGANGVIVPNINTAETAQQAVGIAKFPPDGHRGASLCRATDFGRRFHDYYQSHNDNVIVIVMIEHIEAVKNIDAILSVPGIDGTLIGPYDLSASMGIAGQIDDPKVKDAQQRILEACQKHNVPPGLHIVPTDPAQVRARRDAGYRFIACGLDTNFIMDGCRTLLPKDKKEKTQ